MKHVEYYMNKMISDIQAYGFMDTTILEAIKKVPRHNFMPESVAYEEAYGDHPVPIGEGQTISQPYTVAFMLHLLSIERGLNILEVGTGSGWNAALLKKLVGDKGKITTVELLPQLARMARKHILDEGIDVNIVNGDGSHGYSKNAPYDRIIVTCAAPKIFDAWLRQLKLGGIIVAPVGKYTQEMIRGVKRSRGLKFERLGAFSFVPLRFDYEIF